MAINRLNNLPTAIYDDSDVSIANAMYGWASDLFPIHRSLTGSGVRETLQYLKNRLPELEIKSVASGEIAFDWEVPMEWNVNQAYLIDPEGNRIIDIQNNNLHLVGYSIPFRGKLSLEELESHLFSLESLPDAIPYVTSYYKPFWGFCLAHKDRVKLKKGIYTVCIDTTLEKGQMNYGELYLSGNSKKEILFSTYICHPSMANNELSGPVLATALAQLCSSIDRKYSYRFLFVPETIGSIYFISKNLNYLKTNLLAGFILTCCGDPNPYSYIPSRTGDTYADKILKFALKESNAVYKEYSFLDRGSDERQYCSPNINLPVASVTKAKYGTYKEYHTSLDNMEFVSVEGFLESWLLYKKLIEIIEKNQKYKPNYFCEPMLSKHIDYPSISGKNTEKKWLLFKHVTAYLNEELDTIDLSELLGNSFEDIATVCEILESKNLISSV